MKILHIFPEFRRGGAPVNTLRFIKASGRNLTHYSTGKAADTKFFNEFKNHSESWDIDLTCFSIKSLYKLHRLVWKIRPDIIQLNGKAGSVYGLFLHTLTFRKVRFFLTLRGFYNRFHGLKSRLYCFIEKQISRRVDAVICVSPSERRYYLSVIQAPENKVLIIPNGIDVNNKQLPQKMHEAVQKFQINIVSVSRISPQKDLKTMIQSFSIAADANHGIALHIIGGLSHGEEEYQEEIKKIHRQSPFRERIFFWGDIQQAGNLLCHFDIYLSTAIFEGLPTAVIEAFLNKIPVIGTDCTGNIDLISNEKTGWLTEKRNIESVSKALSFVIQKIHSFEVQEIVNSAHRISLNYSVEHQKKQLLKLYKVTEEQGER